MWEAPPSQWGSGTVLQKSLEKVPRVWPSIMVIVNTCKLQEVWLLQLPWVRLEQRRGAVGLGGVGPGQSLQPHLPSGGLAFS